MSSVRHRLKANLILYDTPGNGLRVKYPGFEAGVSFNQVTTDYDANTALTYDEYNDNLLIHRVSESDWGNISDAAEEASDGSRWVPPWTFLSPPVGAIIQQCDLNRLLYVDGVRVSGFELETSPDIRYTPPSLYTMPNPNLWFFIPGDEGDPCYYGEKVEYWRDGYDGEYLWYNGEFIRIINTAGDDPWAPRILRSTFCLPARPVFAINLLRADVDVGRDDVSKYGTSIVFSESPPGVTPSYGYSLWIPLNGAPQVYYYHQYYTNNKWRVLPKVKVGGMRFDTVPRQEFLNRSEGQTIWLAWVGDRIILSTNGLQSVDAVFSTRLTPSYTKEIVSSDGHEVLGYEQRWFGDTLPSCASRFRIWHKGAQMGFSWLPIFVGDYGAFTSPFHRLPFDFMDYADHVGMAYGDYELEPNDYVYYSWCRSCPADDGYIQSSKRMLKMELPEYHVRILDNAYSRARGMTESYGVDWTLWVENTLGPLPYWRRQKGAQWDEQVYEIRAQWDPTQSAIDPRGEEDSGGFRYYSIRYRHGLPLAIFDFAVGFEGVVETAPSSVVAVDTVKSFNISVDQERSSGSVEVDNYQGQYAAFHYARSSYRGEISADWVDVFGYDVPTHYDKVRLFCGLTKGPESIVGTSNSCRFSFDSIIEMLSRKRIDGTLLKFDGWRVYDAIMYLIHYAGVADNSGLYDTIMWKDAAGHWKKTSVFTVEDTGAVLTLGAAHREAWVAEQGRSVLDLIKEMCLYDWGARFRDRGGVLWKCCPYCGVPRIYKPDDATYHVAYHCDNGWNSSGCFEVDKARARDLGWADADTNGVMWYFAFGGVDYSFWSPFAREVLQVAVAPIGENTEYYNSVMVQGVNQVTPASPLSVEFTDWPSVLGYEQDGDGNPTPYVLGYKKQFGISYPWITGESLARNLAWLLWQARHSITQYVTVTIPFTRGLDVGQTFAFTGGIEEQTVLIQNGIFRIVSVTHAYNKPSDKFATTVRGRWIRDKV